MTDHINNLQVQANTAGLSAAVKDLFLRDDMTPEIDDLYELLGESANDMSCLAFHLSNCPLTPDEARFCGARMAMLARNIFASNLHEAGHPEEVIDAEEDDL